MRKHFIYFAAVLLLLCFQAQGQPVYRFSVKVGIDSESVDSLGGLENVKSELTRMFKRVNRAFNYERQFEAVYNFEIDWDAFYVYSGISTDEVFKPHPDHDYLVVIDGYKSDPKEVGGGWYGSNILTVYHSRTHNDRFNNPFNEQAIDGIIHEFGHGRGVPDIYAMTVDAKNNPVYPIGCEGVRCIMNYPYGETLWSEYAVNMINLAGDKMVNIDYLVAGMCPDRIRIKVIGPNGKAVKKAAISLYPVGWYSYSVSPEAMAVFETDSHGICSFPGDIYGRQESFGLKYPNLFVKAEADGLQAYGWLPLYEVQNAAFEGKKSYDLTLRLKAASPNDPMKFKVER